MLYGNVELLNEKALAVVGTRGITDYGKKYCKKICKEIVLRDIPIVSGMAIGTDTIAHQTTLKYGGKTIAVLPSGFSKIYPKENEKLFNEIIENNGLVITEYEHNISANSKRFLERNRIVAGLGEGLFVVEALFRSGTSVTAKIAKENNKKVFALPGSLDNTYSYGTNNLIKNGANLVINANDILKEFPEFFMREKIKYKKVKFNVNKDFKEICEVISDGIMTVDNIALITKKPVSEVMQKLTLMELEDIVVYEIGKGYKLKEE